MHGGSAIWICSTSPSGGIRMAGTRRSSQFRYSWIHRLTPATPPSPNWQEIVPRGGQTSIFRDHHVAAAARGRLRDVAWTRIRCFYHAPLAAEGQPPAWDTPPDGEAARHTRLCSRRRGRGDQPGVLHHVLPLHPALAGMQVIGMPWRLRAMMTLAVFGQLVGPTLTLLVGLRL